MTAMPNSKSVTAVQAAGAPLVLATVRDGVATLTLNNPSKRNALSAAMLESLRAELTRAAENKAVKAVILAATGPVFSSGHDLREFVGADPAAVTRLLNLCSSVMEQVRLHPKPVIAQVHALASAAGCQLVASCDLVVASSSAQFQTPGVQIGLFCSTPMIPLSRAVAPKKAMEMLLTGVPISAQAAERAGLVNRVVEPAQLAEETFALAAHIVSYSGSILALGKQAFYRQLPLDMARAYEVGQEAMLRNSQMPDAQEGMSAFLQKRSPHWTT
ncbi:MAG: enoyl-CoA hydratase [SAR324 cluster bacterium]